MSENLVSVEDIIKSNYGNQQNKEETNKISFEDFINDKIINNPNKQNEINKDDFIKELEGKVENSNNYINIVNQHFGDKENMKIEELQDKFNPKEEEKVNKEIQFEDKKQEDIENYNENKRDTMKNINQEDDRKSSLPSIDLIYPPLQKSTDLDFLSEDLPEDKNRDKILSSKIEINRKPNYTIDPEIYKQIKNIKNTREESSVIKPINEFAEYEDKDKKYNIFEAKHLSSRGKYNSIEKKKKPLYNDNDLEKFVSVNFDLNNVVLPMNHKKNEIQGKGNQDVISKGIENIKNKNKLQNFEYNRNINNFYSKDYNDDYFFSLYKDFSNQNKSLSVLDNKILKITNKQKESLGILNNYSQNQPNALLNKMKKDSGYNTNRYNNNNNLFEKYGVNQININADNFLHEYQSKDYNIRDPKEKQKYIESLKNELKQFAINKDKQKESRDKNSGFNEVDERLQKLYKMNNLEPKLNEDNNENKIDDNIDNRIESLTEKIRNIKDINNKFQKEDSKKEEKELNDIENKEINKPEKKEGKELNNLLKDDENNVNKNEENNLKINEDINLNKYEENNVEINEENKSNKNEENNVEINEGNNLEINEENKSNKNEENNVEINEENKSNKNEENNVEINEENNLNNNEENSVEKKEEELKTVESNIKNQEDEVQNITNKNEENEISKNDSNTENNKQEDTDLKLLSDMI